MTTDAASPRPLHPDTLALHGGSWRSDPATNAVAVPIYQTTSFKFKDIATAERLAALEEIGFSYSRVANPTQDALERRLAALEGGAAALALASGQAAVASAVLTLAQAGDNIVSSTDLYGGSWNLFNNTLRQLGIEVRLVSQQDPENFRRATDDRTRLYFGETLSNPRLEVFPIAEVAAIGRSFGLPLILDNTTVPLLARPFDHGAAVVVYSATKYIGGHGTTLGGVIIDSGTFPWADYPERNPLLSQPDPSYHGQSWLEVASRFGPVAYLLRARAGLLRDLGAAISPTAAFHLIQGVETLPLRLERHSANAARIADYLKQHPKVSRVLYPGHQEGEARRRADAYLKGGYGGLVGFELAGGADAARRFIDAVGLIYHLANIGDARSLVVHPSTTTHAQLSAEEKLAAGVTPGLVRLSIGIEYADDIIADLSQALERA